MGRARKNSLGSHPCATLWVILLILSPSMLLYTNPSAAAGPTPHTQQKQLTAHLERAAQVSTVALSKVPSASTQMALATRAGSLASAAANYKSQAVRTDLSLYVNAQPPGVPKFFTSSTAIEKSQAVSVYSQVVTSMLTKKAALYTTESNKLSNTLNTMEQLLGSLSLSGTRAVASQVSLEENLVADEHDVNKLYNPGAPPAPAPGMLSIGGPSVLTPLQLANWFLSEYSTTTFRVPIIQMAALYIEQGARLGVRGDVAFIQASMETGGFSVMSGVNDFAGIGDCNSCGGGFDFASVKAGVSAQVELLKAYSDSEYVTKNSPYEWMRALSIHGTCPTWFSLGGVWSSDVYYGEHILGLYLNALDLSLSSQGTNSPI